MIFKLILYDSKQILLQYITSRYKILETIDLLIGYQTWCVSKTSIVTFPQNKNMISFTNKF
jgi:hypothetical protein